MFFVFSVRETRPVGKTCASPAVSDNGKEEEEGARGADDCVILEDGGGGVLDH